MHTSTACIVCFAADAAADVALVWDCLVNRQYWIFVSDLVCDGKNKKTFSLAWFGLYVCYWTKGMGVFLSVCVCLWFFFVGSRLKHTLGKRKEKRLEDWDLDRSDQRESSSCWMNGTGKFEGNEASLTELSPKCPGGRAKRSDYANDGSTWSPSC